MKLIFIKQATKLRKKQHSAKRYEKYQQNVSFLKNEESIFITIIFSSFFFFKEGKRESQ